MVWTSDDVLASCSYDNKVKLYREEDDDWVCFCTLNAHESTVWSVAFNAAGDRMASVSEDSVLKIFRKFEPGNQEGVVCQGREFN